MASKKIEKTVSRIMFDSCFWNDIIHSPNSNAIIVLSCFTTKQPKGFGVFTPFFDLIMPATIFGLEIQTPLTNHLHRQKNRTAFYLVPQDLDGCFCTYFVSLYRNILGEMDREKDFIAKLNSFAIPLAEVEKINSQNLSFFEKRIERIKENRLPGEMTISSIKISHSNLIAKIKSMEKDFESEVPSRQSVNPDYDF
jgi:hypothetical protein